MVSLQTPANICKLNFSGERCHGRAMLAFYVNQARKAR
jgi:hypothetical protein